MTAAPADTRSDRRARHSPWFSRLRTGLTLLVVATALAGCGGGGGGGNNDSGPNGSTASVGTGIPTPGGAVTGLVPAQSSARIALLAGSEAGLGYRNGAASDALFGGLGGIAIDAAGNRYTVDVLNDVIREIDTRGNVTTYAGIPGLAGDVDGSASSAQFQGLIGLAIDSTGDLFVTENTNVVREITSGGQVITIAGVSGQSGSNDGSSTTARFNSLNAITTDGNGNIYVVDSIGLTIREISPQGAVTTIFGSAGMNAGGTNNPVLATSIQALAFDGSGNLFFIDRAALRELAQGGTATTINANIEPGGANNTGLCVGSALTWNGTEFDVSANCSIFTLSTAGFITSIIYTFPPYGYATGYASIGSSIALDAAGNIDLPINAFGGSFIAQFTPGGAMSVFAGVPPRFGDVDGTGTAATFSVVSINGNSVKASGIAADNAGNLYVADSGNNTIRKITPGGVVTTLAGNTQLDSNGNLVAGYADGQGSAARFSQPTGIAVNAAGVIYVADTGNQVIRQITPQGLVTTLAGVPNPSDPGQRADGPGTRARFSVPGPLAIDLAGNLYVGDNTYIALEGHAEEVNLNGTVLRKITPAGVVSTVAGDASSAGFADGPYASAQFGSITAVAIDPAGHIIVADNGAEREITNGTVKTVPGAFGAAFPFALTIDGAGNLYYITDLSSEIYEIDHLGNHTLYAGSSLTGLRPGTLPGGLNLPTALTVNGNGLAVMMVGGVATIQ